MQCEELVSFEENLRETESSKFNDATIEARRSEIQGIWAKWKLAYKICIADPKFFKIKSPQNRNEDSVHPSGLKI